jgi:hypothetical protein
MAAKDIEAGRAHVLISLRDKVTAGLTRVQKNFSSWGKSFAAAGGALTAASAGIITPLLAAASGFVSAGDAIQKMSIRTGFSAEALSELNFAAQQSGTDLATVEKGAARMQRTITDANSGMAGSQKILQDLGLDYQQLAKLSPENQFMAVAASLRQVADPTERAGRAMQLFGRSGTQLLPLLTSDIGALRDEAHQLGLTMSTDDANAAAELGDAMNRVTQSIKAAWLKVGAAIAPALTKISNIVSSVTGAVANWVDVNRPLVVGIAAAAVAVGALGAVLVGVGLGLITVAGTISAIVSLVGVIGGAFAAIGATIAAIFSPFGLAVAAVLAGLIGLGVAAYVFRAQLASAIAAVVQFFQPLTDAVFRVWSVFAEGFAAVVSMLGSGRLTEAANIAWLGFTAAAWQAIAELGNAIGFAIDYVAAIVPGVGAMRDFVVGAFGSIGQAILAGRWDLAVAIAMAKIRLAVESGLNVVRAYWTGFTTIIGDLWDNIVFGIRSTWRTAVTEIAKSFVWVAEQFGLSMDGVSQELDRMRAADQRADDKAKASKNAARYSAGADILAANKAREDQLRQQIGELEAQSAEAFATAGAPTIEDVAAKARDALKQSITDAQNATKKTADAKPGDPLLAQAGAAAEQLSKITSAGTFGAASAAQALGVDTTAANQTAKNTKKMVDLMQNQQAQPVFE